MTIPFLDISFDGIFEFGQAYVALSRAVDLNTTIIRDFNRSRVKTHRRVVDFNLAVQAYVKYVDLLVENSLSTHFLGFYDNYRSVKGSEVKSITTNMHELQYLLRYVLDIECEETDIDNSSKAIDLTLKEDLKSNPKSLRRNEPYPHSPEWKSIKRKERNSSAVVTGALGLLVE